MTQRDYYEILEVERTASADEIKRAYRKMALKYHPDHNPGDAEAEKRFKEAAEAYEILRDPDKRARYDQYGHAGVNGGGNSFGGFSSTEDIFAHFGDIFGDIFGFGGMGGARRGGPRAEAGADLRYNLTISFEQAARGTEMTLTIPRQATCQECGGSGAAKGSTRDTCPQCHGSGQVRHAQGFFQFAVTCPKCKGAGSIVSRVIIVI
ncbi:MAG: DnaJ domain-containing protein, partial [Deltaproteobacteria bacterium]|nr:DnaJ domain-containing protein [Deltaproteobacteria bacterium]